MDQEVIPQQLKPISKKYLFSLIILAFVAGCLATIFIIKLFNKPLMTNTITIPTPTIPFLPENLPVENTSEYIYLKSDNPGVEHIEALMLPGENFYRMYLLAINTDESKTAPQTKEEIHWKLYNVVGFIDPQIRYSFQFPYPGPYCEGCFDGWPFGNQMPNIEGEWITGGHYDPQSTDRKWSLSSGIMYRGIQSTDGRELDAVISPMIENMLKTPVGTIIKIPDWSYESNKPVYEATRLTDMVVGNNTFAMYKTTNKDEMYYALLDKGSYVVVFTYSYYSDLYNIFDKIIQSYQPILRDNATYGQLAPVNSLDGFTRIKQ